jgi:DNA-binding transcriptional LysR family regulator
MVPTHKTENIISDLQNALNLMQRSINEPGEFNPTSSERVFRISLGDISEGRILPYLLEYINKNSPGIVIESYYTDRKDIVHSLATNELNFAVDPIIPRSKDVKTQKVFSDNFVCAHRANHPLTKLKKLDLDALLELKFINISNRKRGPAVIDTELAKLQLQRNIVLRAQHFLVTPEIVRNTDLVLVCSRSFAKKHGLNFKELPIELPPVEQYLIWHNSDDNDGSHIWMRELIAEAFREAQIT